MSRGSRRRRAVNAQTPLAGLQHEVTPDDPTYPQREEISLW